MTINEEVHGRMPDDVPTFLRSIKIMRDLSLHLLDLAQKQKPAGAKHISMKLSLLKR